MKKIRIALLSALLSLVAFATMAPHFTTWDSGVHDASIDIELVSLSLTPRGNALHGDAEITLKLPAADPRGEETTYPGTATLTARCIAPLCGGWFVRGTTKFGSTSGGVVTRGQGTFSGEFSPVFDAAGNITGFTADGVPLRARIGTFPARR